ncbi:Mediator of DNA damage checkpoint protein 1, partial [Quaeritorhiza haematococci]
GAGGRGRTKKEADEAEDGEHAVAETTEAVERDGKEASAETVSVEAFSGDRVSEPVVEEKPVSVDADVDIKAVVEPDFPDSVKLADAIEHDVEEADAEQPKPGSKKPPPKKRGGGRRTAAKATSKAKTPARGKKGTQATSKDDDDHGDGDTKMEEMEGGEGGGEVGNTSVSDPTSRSRTASISEASVVTSLEDIKDSEMPVKMTADLDGTADVSVNAKDADADVNVDAGEQVDKASTLTKGGRKRKTAPTKIVTATKADSSGETARKRAKTSRSRSSTPAAASPVDEAPSRSASSASTPIEESMTKAGTRRSKSPPVKPPAPIAETPSADTSEHQNEEEILAPGPKKSTKQTPATSSTKGKTGSRQPRRAKSKTPPEDVEAGEDDDDPLVSAVVAAASSSSSLSRAGSARGARGKRANSQASTPARTPSSSNSAVASRSSSPKIADVCAAVYNIPMILFTGIAEDDARNKLIESLGGLHVENWSDCTHLVTDRVRRTVKFLCALSAGKLIVNLKWLDACKKDKKFVDAFKYLLKDKAVEKSYQFSLEKSLQRTIDQSIPRLFHGLKFYATPSVKPAPADLSEILNAAGAELITDLPATKVNDDDGGKPSDSIVVIGSLEDKDRCREIMESTGRIIQSTEFVLTGILRQEVDFVR